MDHSCDNICLFNLYVDILEGLEEAATKDEEVNNALDGQEEEKDDFRWRLEILAEILLTMIFWYS